MKHFDKVLHSWKTVFRYADIGLLLGTANRNTIKAFLRRGVDQGVFVSIASGIYGLYSYDILELASSLRKQSYISLETVLQKEGVIFQDYSHTITLVSDNTRRRAIAGVQVHFFKIRESILLNPLGIEYTGKYFIASKERAICDRIYLSGEQYFDHLDHIDWSKLTNIARIYDTATAFHIHNLIKNASKR